MRDFLREDPPQPSLPINLPKYRFAVYGGLAVILGPVTLWFLRRLLPGQPILLPLQDINPLPLLAATILLVISWLIRILRMWYLFRHLARNIAYSDFIRTCLAGAFVSHITPSAAGGYPFFLFLLHRQGVPASKSLAVSLMDSVNTGLSLLLILAAGAALSPVFLSAASSWLPAAAAGTLFLIGPALALLIFANKLPAGASKLFGKDSVLGRKTTPLTAKAAREVERFKSAAGTLWRDHRPVLAINLLFNLTYWAIYLSTTHLLFRAVGGRAPWLVIAGSQIAVQFAQYLIPTPGAAGGAEVTMALLVQNLLGHGQLVAFLALWRIYTYYFSLFATSLTLPWAICLLRKDQ
ncbi:MAG: flippase-like domain-containing protein [Firmicutes bacterium]|jgi:uncharacterized protein (TIRG00374 family)|nr:flippase-like domain-containing protein [Bacillota bacterium]